MLQNNQHILITADVDESLLHELKSKLHELKSKDFVVDVVPFIRTEIIKTKNLQKQIEDIAKLSATVVFTSKNAVKAISEYLFNQKSNWKIYCIGNTTKALVEKLFDEDSIAGVGNNVTEIAEKIISDNNTNEVYFFCGDKRRDELPELLMKQNIIVTEIDVYTTTILHKKVEKNYNAVLFFSPSAVEGFFANNIVSDKTVLFAIGETTANEIKKYSANKIIVSSNPDKKSVIENVITFC